MDKNLSKDPLKTLAPWPEKGELEQAPDPILRSLIMLHKKDNDELDIVRVWHTQLKFSANIGEATYSRRKARVSMEEVKTEQGMSRDLVLYQPCSSKLARNKIQSQK